MERTKIYYLHYGDNVPIYVGKSNRIQGRIPSHRKKFGSDIVIEILDDVPLHEWKFWECFWIEQFKQWGYVLSNKNNGGGGATKQNFSPIRSQKISKARLGKPMPHKGKKFTEEHKEKIKSTRGFLQSRPNTWTNQPVLQYNLDGTFKGNLARSNQGYERCCQTEISAEFQDRTSEICFAQAALDQIHHP